MNDVSTPQVNFSGSLVSLGPLRRELIPDYHRWNNHPTTSQTRGLSWPSTLEQETATYNHRVGDRSAIYFTIYERTALRPIGIAHLYDIDDRHSRASYGIIIGEPEDHGKGFGTEATQLVLGYAFHAYGLENVMLTVASFNVAGIRAYEKAGFKTFGLRRNCSRFGERLCDLVYMECLASEHHGARMSAFRYDGRDDATE